MTLLDAQLTLIGIAGAAVLFGFWIVSVKLDSSRVRGRRRYGIGRR